jgi:hypothetical protein
VSLDIGDITYTADGEVVLPAPDITRRVHNHRVGKQVGIGDDDPTFVIGPKNRGPTLGSLVPFPRRDRS